MARPRTSPLTSPASVAGALARPLSARSRQSIADDVRAWLRWQDTLAGWRPQKSAVDAIPFVALYAGGQLRGCVGSSEGGPGQRLGRAFLSALGDLRFGGVRVGDRRDLAAEVSFMRAPRFGELAEIAQALEVGTHGVGLARGTGMPVFLLPSVARDGELDAQGMLEALRRKAGPEPGAMFLFETETVVVRPHGGRGVKRSPEAAAAAWLASLVHDDGSLIFAIDARTGKSFDVGRMHHGRGATVVQALALHGGHAREVKRARARLRSDIVRALAGGSVPGWPDHPAEVAGTLALAVRAGVGVEKECIDFAAANDKLVAAVPWHAGQVLSAVGKHAPSGLAAACIRDLERQPWAPWTVLGQHASGDRAISAIAVGALVASIRADAPHVGAVRGAKFAETAITALTVEALARCPASRETREATKRARAFLARHQLVHERLPAPFLPALSLGAFMATPTSSILRGDVTAHALLALA